MSPYNVHFPFSSQKMCVVQTDLNDFFDGFEIGKGDGAYTITFTGFSLTGPGDSIGPYEPLVDPLDVTFSFSSNS